MDGRFFELGKTFQKRRVSSPAPVTMVDPSGDMVRQSTRMVCPMRVDTFSILGYFQMLISLKEYPWVLTSSLMVLPKIRLQTWEPVSMERMVQPVRVFRKRMFLSAVPPPEARRPCWWGDHATALTAAMWSLNFRTGDEERAFQIISLLSFPPEQSCCSSGDHFNPQISCLCPCNFPTKADPHRGSLCKMVLSLDPVLRREELHEMEPTRLECPCITRTLLTLFTSHRCTSPLLVPRQKEGPLAAQPTEVTVSDNPKSHNLVTLELSPFQRQTLEARPTARQFCCDQSIRLRQKSSCRAGASSTLNGILLIFLLALIEVTNSYVKSRVVFSLQGSRAARGEVCWVYLKRLLFWKSQMGDYDLMLLLGELMMHLRQMSDRDSEQGSAGEGGLFQLDACLSYLSLAISSGLSCRLVGMKRSVTTVLSLPQSSPISVQPQNESTVISRSLERECEVAMVLLEEVGLVRGDSGLLGQEQEGKAGCMRLAMGSFSNRNYNACLAIWTQKEYQIKLIQYPSTKIIREINERDGKEEREGGGEVRGW